jgi:hypothetical protein
MGNSVSTDTVSQQKRIDQAVDQSKVDEVILNLKAMRMHLQSLEGQQEQIQRRALELARALAKTGQRDKVTFVLTEKKLRQIYLDRARLQRENTQKLIDILENEENALAIIGSVIPEPPHHERFAACKMQGGMSIENLENLMDDTPENMQRMKDLQALLAQDLTAQDLADVESECELMIGAIDADPEEPPRADLSA